MGELRWTTVDLPGADGGQEALFDADELAGHHVGSGEFRGMEFLHVRARTIINRIPPVAHLPFSHTINVYRGCSHACSYCLAGDTRVLMADGCTTALSDVRVGDVVCGTRREGAYRRYVPATVLDHWSTSRPAYRVRLADGTILVASGDHRFLTRRGWKHVSGTSGARWRPHLTPNDHLLGLGGGHVSELADEPGRRAYPCGTIRGDGHLKQYTYARQPRREVVYRFSPARAGAEALSRSGEDLGHFGVNTDAFASSEGTEHRRARRSIRSSTVNGRAVKTSPDLRVVSVEALGIDLPMYDITTATGDFIANGVVSHNCFARPTHDYLGLGIGDDFERKIVVKINAVELLRAELAAKRWPGHHIAMGTNTDPYQRCEGKYHLTRGVVETLAEQANPFSILTKSTLILRDLDLLVAAAKRTDVRVNLSIGTLDEEVWRLSEPGTPAPRQRVEAVRRLREAGLDCGVLVAPILPGLSDSPEQLEEVIESCVEAGSTSISAVPLHLRSGLRDHYLGWLARQRPDLLDEHRRRYTRAYLPLEDRQELAALVRRLVDQARARRRPSGGTGWRTAAESRLVEGSFTRRLREQMGGDAVASPAPVEPAPTQLDLF